MCKDWLPEAWTAQAKATAQKNRRKAAAAAKAVKKASETMDDSVELHAPEDALQTPSKRTKSKDSSKAKQPQFPLNPSPWLPASRRWDGPAPTGRTIAGRGRLNVREDTARKNVTILRDISRHAVTATAATGERASGPGQVPLVVPARVDVPSPAVSLRRRTPVRRALPLAIIIILRAIVDPSHHLHLGRLQTASLSPVTARDDERVPIGRVRRLSPDGMSSYLLRSPRPLRSVR